MSFYWNLGQSFPSGRRWIMMYSIKDMGGCRNQGTSVCPVNVDSFSSIIKVSLKAVFLSANTCLSLPLFHPSFLYTSQLSLIPLLLLIVFNLTLLNLSPFSCHNDPLPMLYFGVPPSPHPHSHPSHGLQHRMGCAFQVLPLY